MTSKTSFNLNVPASSTGYMKLQQGENRIRILAEPVEGWEYWTTVDGKQKPIRSPLDQQINVGDVEGTVKYFAAFLVYNYQAEQIQILNITQKSIARAISDYSKSEDWSDPTKYDFKINKTGEGQDTRYSIMTGIPKELDKTVLDLVKNTKVDLTKLYATKENPYGGDPFEGSKDNEIDDDEFDDLALDEVTDKDLAS